MADTSDPTEPLNPNPQQQTPPNYSATGPTALPATGPTAQPATGPTALPATGPAAPPEGAGLPYPPAGPPYPPDGPPQYGEVFQDKPAGGVPPAGHQAYMMPGPAPMPGPAAPFTAVNYQAGQATIIATPMILSSFPVMVTCPQCNLHVTTHVMYVAGTLTWLLSILLLLVGFWLCCCLFPFCLDGCKDAVHTCPNCHFSIGTYRRM